MKLWECLLVLVIMVGIVLSHDTDSSNNETLTCVEHCNLNHGFCQPDEKCSCYSGWEGESCDRCVRSSGCIHGTCDKPGQCNCLEGYGGRHCQLDLQYCERHQPCHNGATCFNDGNGSFRCTCSRGFRGKTCLFPSTPGTTTTRFTPSRNLDPYCLHGGTCVFGNNYVGCEKCSCPTGYVGDRCETLVRMCVQRPCANGGSCIDLVNDFHCVCAQGYFGRFCNQDVNECEKHGDQTCENGGTCVNRRGSYMCMCREGYEGVRCDKTVQRITPTSNTFKPLSATMPSTISSSTSKTSSSALHLLIHGKPHRKPAPQLPHVPIRKQSSTNIKVTHIVSQLEVESSHSEVINHVMEGNGLLSIKDTPADQQSSVPLVQAVTFAFLGIAVALFAVIGFIVWYNVKKRRRCLNFRKSSSDVRECDVESMQLNEKRSSFYEDDEQLVCVKQNNLKQSNRGSKPGLVVRTVTPPSKQSNLKPNNHRCYYVDLPYDKQVSDLAASNSDETNALVGSTKHTPSNPNLITTCR